MKLTTKTAQRFYEINKLLVHASGEPRRNLLTERNSYFEVKNELKEIVDISRDYSFNRWHRLNPDELRGIIEEYQEELLKITNLIKEIESAENDK